MGKTIKPLFKTRSLIVLLSILFTACNNDRCEEEYVLIPLPEEYKNWFKDVDATGSSVYKKARASSGLEESIGFGRSNNTEIIKGPPYKPCYYPSGQVIGVGYRSSLYNNTIGISLVQQHEGEAPVLRLQVEERSTEIIDRINMQFRLKSFKLDPITVARYRFSQASTENIQTNDFPEVVTVDSVVVNGKVYNQVYKITNPYMQNNGTPFSLTEFYIDKNFGLIQYVQKDGVIWQII